jgi:hypothetical protein
MSRTLSSISPNTAYVSPNQLVTAQLATNVGFNPNDYVYAYGNNQVGNLGSTIGVGLVNTFIAGTQVNGFIQTGLAPTAVMSGPYSATATYTGATRTQGNLLQTSTSFSASTSGTVPRICVLNNGNIAVIWRDSAASDCKIAIFTNAGVSVKAATTISSQTNAGAYIAANGISAMTDGGFVVCYTSNTTSYYQRFNSAGTTVVSETQISGTLSSAQNYLSVAAGKGGDFAFVGNNSNGQAYTVHYTSSNVYSGQVTLTSATNWYDNDIVGLSNGNYAAVGIQGANTVSYLIVSSSVSIVAAYNSLNGGSTPNDVFNCAAYDGGFVIASRNTSTAAGRLISIANNGTQLNTGVSNGVSSSQPSVCVGENNTAYFMFLNNNTGQWNVSKYNSINTTSPTLETTFVVNSFSPGAYTGKNLYNALNGALYYGFRTSSTNLPAFVTVNQATYTQNVTALTNQGFYTPTNGYYFLGIGATTAAANTSGLIYTNGGIALPSTYPSVSTGYAFDYQSNSYWAQRGTINGRAINLQGAQ